MIKENNPTLCFALLVILYSYYRCLLYITDVRNNGVQSVLLSFVGLLGFYFETGQYFDKEEEDGLQEKVHLDRLRNW